MRNASPQAHGRGPGINVETFSVSIDLFPDVALILRLDGAILRANGAAAALFEVDTIDQLVGKNISSMEELAPLLTRTAIGDLQLGKTIRFEHEFRTFRGNRRTIDFLHIPLLGADGTVDRAVAFGRDVTNERTLERSRELLAAVVESSDEGIVSIANDLRITSWNRGAERLVGYSKDEAMGRFLFEVYVTPNDRELASLSIEQAFAELSHNPAMVRHLEAAILRKDGAVVDVSLAISGILDPSGKVLGMSAVIQDISERKRAEREQAMLAGIVNASDDAIVAYSHELKIISWNHAAERIYGYSEKEALGRGLDLFVPREELEQSIAGCRAVLETGQTVTFEQSAPFTNGRTLVSCFPLRDASGKVVAGSGIGRDITRLKQIEGQLRDAQQYTRGLIESSIDPMVVVDLEMRITDANERFSTFTQIPKKLLIGSRFDGHFLDRTLAMRALEQTLAAGFVRNFELVLRDGAGKEVLIAFNASVFYGDGKVAGIFGVARDITEQRAIEHTLRQEQAYSRSLIECTPDALLVSDSNLVLTDANERCTALTGYPRAQLIGSSFGALFQDRDRAVAAVREALASGFVRDTELTLLTRTADEIPVALNTAVFKDSDGSVRGVLVAMRDASERKRYEKERSLLASIVDSSGDAIYSELNDLTITSWNAAAEKLLGYAAAEIISRNSGLLVPLDRRAEMAEQTQIIQQTAKSVHLETKRLHKDGRLIDVMMIVSPMLDLAGKVTAMSVTAHDISERKQIEQESKRTRDSALETARLKAEFLANMSHEIRTPLNSIIGMTGLLLDTNLSAEQVEFANHVRDSGDALLSLINEILDFSKISAGKVILETLDFELETMLEGAIEVVAELARRKGLELTVAVDPDAPQFLSGDPGRLRQVLINLLGNAIKFTAQGHIDLVVHKLSENPKGAVLRVEVSDTGIGIPAEKQHLLFQPFSQVDASTTRHFGGTGLGLSISRELVERMGGTIAVSSNPGGGSTFWFTAKLAKQRQHNRPRSGRFDTLVGTSVLVIDDNNQSRENLSRQMSGWGMNVVTAANGAAALDALEGTRSAASFQLAIVDVAMPEVDGIELVRAMKHEPAFANSDVIFVSSVGARSDYQARLAGLEACGWLVKPVPHSTLYNAIVKLLGRPASDYVRDQSEPASDGAAGQASRQGRLVRSDGTRLRVLVADDDPINQKLARLQLKKLGLDADTVANGVEAVEAVMRLPYDIVLMDCQMPEMDGYEATKEIRRRQGSANHTRIVAMTAHALQGDDDKCRAAGMDAYISKPVRPAALEKALRQVVDSMASRAFDDQIIASSAVSAAAMNEPQSEPIKTESAELEAPPTSLAPVTRPNSCVEPTINKMIGNRDENASDLASVDPETIAELRLESDGMLNELIDLFLHSAPRLIREMEGGLSRDDLELVGFRAHRLKGTSSTFGALRLAKLCQRLDEATKMKDSASALGLYDQIKPECDRVLRALQAESSTRDATASVSPV